MWILCLLLFYLRSKRWQIFWCKSNLNFVIHTNSNGSLIQTGRTYSAVTYFPQNPWSWVLYKITTTKLFKKFVTSYVIRNVHDRLHKKPALILLLSYTNPVVIQKSYFLKLYFNIILSSTTSFPKCFISFIFFWWKYCTHVSTIMRVIFSFNSILLNCSSS